MRLLFLRDTQAGRGHDQRIADTTPYPRPVASQRWQERGFQAFTLDGVDIIQPTRKPRGHELTRAQKARKLWRLGGLYAALQAAEFYRQRFFLGGRAEWGLHWRAGLLRLAKWPYLMLALLDALLDRQHPYQLTPKVRAAGRPSLVLWAQLPVVTLLGLAWLVGMAAGHPLPDILQQWTLGLGLTCLALIATDWWPFPPPYDRRLWGAKHRGKAGIRPEGNASALS